MGQREYPIFARIHVRDPEIREVIVWPFRVVYRYRNGVVDIATVFRGSRLFPSIE